MSLRPESNPKLTKRDAVIESEQAWQEQESLPRRSLNGLLYNSPAFTRLVNAQLTFLQAIPGQQVLDLGSGKGNETLMLAKRGLAVISVDLSFHQLIRARKLLERIIPGAKVFFLQADAERLPFDQGTFRKIYGKAILHHLDLDRAAGEVLRILADGGRATFAEPMRYHPLFWPARNLTPRLRIRHEHPLKRGELARFGDDFSISIIQEFFLISPLAYPLRWLAAGEHLFRVTHAFLQDIDTWLFKLFPFLKLIAWLGVIKLEK